MLMVFLAPSCGEGVWLGNWFLPLSVPVALDQQLALSLLSSGPVNGWPMSKAKGCMNLDKLEDKIVMRAEKGHKPRCCGLG